MKKLVLLFVLLMASTELYAHDFEVIDHGERHTCYSKGEEQQPVTCVPNCMQRHSDGSCFNYKADFCGINPSCVPNCMQRSSNGDCYNYYPDTCSEGK